MLSRNYTHIHLILQGISAIAGVRYPRLALQSQLCAITHNATLSGRYNAQGHYALVLSPASDSARRLRRRAGGLRQFGRHYLAGRRGAGAMRQIAGWMTALAWEWASARWRSPVAQSADLTAWSTPGAALLVSGLQG
jgi:predicted benzoate:H+ symporter BenE